MVSGMQCIGWLLLRTPDRAALGDFYQNTLNFTHIRQHGETPIFWVGETVVLGVNPGGRVLPEFTDPRMAPMIPVFYFDDLNATITEITTRGVRFLGEPFATRGGRRVYILDLDNNVIGLEQRNAGSENPQDALAVGRQDDNTIPFQLPAGFQRLGRIVVHCQNIEQEAAFYRDTVGLKVLYDAPDSVEFAIGDVVTLELAPGTEKVFIPTNRDEVNVAFALRVVDVNVAAAELHDRGVTFVNEPFDIGGGRVGYFVDAEGHTIGIQTRSESSERVEDREARRRVAAGLLPS